MEKLSNNLTFLYSTFFHRHISMFIWRVGIGSVRCRGWLNRADNTVWGGVGAAPDERSRLGCRCGVTDHQTGEWREPPPDESLIKSFNFIWFVPSNCALPTSAPQRSELYSYTSHLPTPDVTNDSGCPPAPVGLAILTDCQCASFKAWKIGAAALILSCVIIYFKMFLLQIICRKF